MQSWPKIGQLRSRGPLMWPLISVLLLVAGAPSLAQHRWSVPERIPNYDDQGRPPIMVADQNRTVHAFNAQSIERDGMAAIFYRQWQPEQGWTTPVDILLTENTGARSVQGVYLDPEGVFHLIFFGQSPRGDVIRYSRAFAADADRAPAWSEPRVIGSDAGPQPIAALSGDGNGGLVVVYSGKKDGIGLYEVHSHDAGNTWSEPQVVQLVYDQEHWPIAIEVDRDGEGRLHAAWSLVNASGFGTEVYYARREGTPPLWSEPTLLADKNEDDYAANWPSIVVHKDELFVIYMDDFPPTRWMRRSNDSGQTWTAAERLFPHEGEYATAVLLEDSGGTLHIILGNRLTALDLYGMWHSEWLGTTWNKLEPIVSGPKTAKFDPSNPQAIISQGNYLLATWWTDTVPSERDGVWYSFARLEAPELPTETLVAPPVTTIPMATATPSVEAVRATPTPNPIVPKPGEELATRNPGTLVMIGLTPTVLVIAIVVFFRCMATCASSQ